MIYVVIAQSVLLTLLVLLWLRDADGAGREIRALKKQNTNASYRIEEERGTAERWREKAKRLELQQADVDTGTEYVRMSLGLAPESLRETIIKTLGDHEWNYPDSLCECNALVDYKTYDDHLIHVIQQALSEATPAPPTV